MSKIPKHATVELVDKKTRIIKEGELRTVQRKVWFFWRNEYRYFLDNRGKYQILPFE